MRVLVCACLFAVGGLLVVPSAAADCTSSSPPGDSWILVCEDENGNAAPDRVLVRLEGNYVSFSDRTICWDGECRNYTVLFANAGAADAEIDVDVLCTGHVGSTQLECHDASAHLTSPVLLLGATYDAEPEGTVICAGVRVPFEAPIVECVDAPPV